MLKYINNIEICSDESGKEDSMKKVLIKKIILKNKLKTFCEWESNSLY